MSLPEPIVCADCGRNIGGTAEPIRVNERTRAHYTELGPGEYGAWCRACKRLTVYVGVA